MKITESRLRRIIRSVIVESESLDRSAPTYDEFKSWLKANLDAKQRMLFMTLKRNVDFGNPSEMIESNMFDIRDQVILPSLEEWLGINITSSTHRMVKNFLYLVSNAILSPVCKNISGIDKNRKLNYEDKYYFAFICGILRDYESKGITLDDDIYRDTKELLSDFIRKYNF